MTNENQLMIGLGYCIFMLIISFIYFKYPPKKKITYMVTELNDLCKITRLGLLLISMLQNF